MSQHASQAELNKFVKVVDEFKTNYARLVSPKMRADVYRSQNPALISDYESAVIKGRSLNLTINGVVGAWNAFKSGYSATTDVTSQYIGDAVDWIKGLFGNDPNEGLGALQIPAAVGVAGIIAAALLLNKSMSAIFVSVEASRIQRENPNVSRAAALQRARSSLPSLLPKGLTFGMIAAGLGAAWILFGRGK